MCIFSWNIFYISCTSVYPCISKQWNLKPVGFMCFFATHFLYCLKMILKNIVLWVIRWHQNSNTCTHTTPDITTETLKVAFFICTFSLSNLISDTSVYTRWLWFSALSKDNCIYLCVFSRTTHAAEEEYKLPMPGFYFVTFEHFYCNFLYSVSQHLK